MLVAVPDPGQVLRWFDGPIDVRVEVDTGIGPESGGLWDEAEWDTDVWGSEDAAWLDISQFVLDVDISAGAVRWGERFQAGTARIKVDNTTGIFTPDTSGETPWHLPFRPRRRIRVVCLPDPTDSTKVPLFTGVIDFTKDDYSGDGFDITTTIHCYDFMGVWANHDPLMSDTATGVQGTHTRVGAALDKMGWPAGSRDIQTGEHTMQSSFLAQTTLEECQKAADAEGGAFFCSKDGLAVFKARDWLTTDTRSVNVQGYIGYDEVTEGDDHNRMTDLSPSWESTRIVNQVRFARIGSTMQEVEDETSQALFEDIMSYQRTDFQNNSDTEVLFLAQRYLDANKDSRMRLDAVTITPNADPDNEDLNRLIWATEFGDRLSVLVATPHGWEFERETHVFHIHHHITPSDWEVTFRLDDAQTLES